MTKKRVLTVGDASFVNTGYAIYLREILSRLHQHPDYEVAELACFTDCNNPENKKIPWKFYPNAVPLNDSRINEYRSNNINVFGSWRFNRCLADFKPHIVFDVRDFWMFSYQENSPYKKYFNWIIMPATDSGPPKTEWLYTFNNADVVMPYTDWARKVLTESCGKNINLFPKIANAGINPNEFYPLEDKKQHKINLFGKDVSVVGAVMRNQKRKLFPDLMIAYKKYLENIKDSDTELYNKSYLYLHTSYPEDNGWDIPSLLLEYGLLDKTYFTYICRECRRFFPSKFQGSVIPCKSCAKGACTLSASSVGVNVEQLNQVYNCFDLFIQYAICLGKNEPIRIRRDGNILWMPISQVKIGDEAWTHKNRWKKVSNVWKNLAKSHNKKILELSVHGDYEKLIATENHEFPAYTTKEIKNNKNRTIREKIGDKLRQKQELPEPGSYELASLKPGDMLLYPIDDTIIDIDSVDISKEIDCSDYLVLDSFIETPQNYSYPRHIKIDNEFCRFIGLFAADGNANIHVCGSSIKVTSNIVEINNHALCQNSFKLLSSDKNVKSFRNYKNRMGRDDILNSKIHAELFAKWFSKHENKKLPDWCLYLPLEKQKEILIGMFMGDGHYCEEKKYSQIGTISKELADQIKHILRRLRIPFSVSKLNRTKHKTQDQKNRQDIYSFEIYGCDIKNGDMTSKRNGTHNVYYKNNHLIKIKNIIESNYKDDVWCVTINDDNTMTTKISATKNCEGFGIPVIEAASCGVPIISVDHSAMTEIAENVGGSLVPVKRTFRELETNADRVYPDIEYTTRLIYDFFIKNSEETRKQKGIETRKRCIDIYTWDKVYEVWLECFDSIDINSKKPWSSEPIIFDNSVKVPKDLDNESFVSFICTHVIKNPDLLKTAAVQTLIKDLNMSLVAKNGSISTITRQQVVQILEGYLGNEINCDKMRLDNSLINKEDFIK